MNVIEGKGAGAILLGARSLGADQQPTAFGAGWAHAVYYGHHTRPFHQLPNIFSEVAKINPKSCRKVAKKLLIFPKVAPNLIKMFTSPKSCIIYKTMAFVLCFEMLVQYWHISDVMHVTADH